MHRLRLHSTTAVLLFVVLALAASAFVFTRAVRRDNEDRLLDAQAAQLGTVVQSLASQEQGTVVSAAVLADQSHGDQAAFSSLVTANSAPGEAQGWALLSHRAGKVVASATVGADSSSLIIFSQPTMNTDNRIKLAFAGKFEVIGIYGSGLTRRIVIAAGAPGPNNQYVAYEEIPLIEAASETASSGVIGSDENIALYVGATANPQGLVFATGKTTGHAVTSTVNIGDSPVTYVVWSKHPLTGTLASDLPWLSFLFLLMAGLVVGTVVEMNLRKRDAALLLVEERDLAAEQRDIADQHRAALETQLQRAQRLEAAGQLAGGVAHDFNNLLAAIMSYADLIADDLGDHPARADVDEIRKAARRGGRLTSQLLQFGSRAPRADESIEINEGINELHGLLSRAVGEEIALETHLEPALPSVAFGAGELEQVLMNLVVNARDAIDGPGTISITTELVRDSGDSGDSGDPGSESDDGNVTRVRLMVSDTGSGMPAEVVAHIFEPFFTTKERGRGTGLGLATVYGIVTRAGGTIDVHSTPGLGTLFDITLKASSDEPETPVDIAPPATQMNAGDATILLVEDEESFRVPIRRMLERAGYHVVDAADGARAEEIVREGPVDLLLTDVIMPGGMNGKELADRLQSRDPNLPVIFMSGYSADLLARRGVEEDGPNRLQKPFSEDALLAAIAAALQSRSGVPA